MKFNSKEWFWHFLNATLVVAVILGITISLAVVRASNATQPTRTITVSGEGSVKVEPDIAELRFSVVSEAKVAKDAEDETSEKISKAVSFLKDSGVKDKDIKTSNVNLYPRYSYRPLNGIDDQQQITGYEARISVTAQLRDLETASDIVSGLTEYGVNQIDSFNFQVEDPDQFTQSAREEAFDNAWNKAKNMADAAGVNIARVVTFYESNGSMPRVMYAEAAYGMGGDAMVKSPSAQLEPGQEEINVTVQVTYEIR